MMQIAVAGGFTAEADLPYSEQALNRAQKLQDGDIIYIPSRNQPVAALAVPISVGTQNAPVVGSTSPQKNHSIPGNSLISINSASKSELESLPGIGPAHTDKIIAQCPNSSIDQLCSQKVVRADTCQNITPLIRTIGSKEPMSDQFAQAVKSTGVSHIIVASGFNVIIIILSVTKLSRYLGKWWPWTLSIIFIFCYIILSGVSPAIIRANIMGIMAGLAVVSGRQCASIRVLIIAAGAMLLVNPNWLFDFGFQLSFGATL
jgi:DNA uptake protein ComE-like DNA-binding protein